MSLADKSFKNEGIINFEKECLGWITFFLLKEEKIISEWTSKEWGVDLKTMLYHGRLSIKENIELFLLIIQTNALKKVWSHFYPKYTHELVILINKINHYVKWKSWEVLHKKEKKGTKFYLKIVDTELGSMLDKLDSPRINDLYYEFNQAKNVEDKEKQLFSLWKHQLQEGAFLDAILKNRKHKTFNFDDVKRKWMLMLVIRVKHQRTQN